MIKYKKIKKYITLTLIAALIINIIFCNICFTANAQEDILAKTTYNNNTYAIINIELNWNDAKDYCEAVGGHLATITSHEEDETLYNLLRSTGNDGALLGASDFSGKWSWVTGETWDYENWAPGEPSDSREHYLSYHRNCGSQWNDWDEAPGIFICEWESASGSFSNNENAFSGIITKEYWDHPNGSIYTAYILKLDNAVNINADGKSATNVSEIQLWSGNVDEQYIGKKVRVKGDIHFQAGTIYYRRDIVITNITIELMNQSPEENTERGFDITRDTWPLLNTYETFGYGENNEKMSVDRWTKAYGEFMKPFAEHFTSAWSGNCYGLASTAYCIYKGILDLQLDSEVNESGIARTINKSGTDFLVCDEKIQDIIERFQISQWSSEYSFNYDRSLNDERPYSEIFTDVINNIKYNKKSYLISAWAPKEDGSVVGHALVVDSSREPEVNEQTGECKIYVYDPNYPHYDNNENYNLFFSYNNWDERILTLNKKTGTWSVQITTNASGSPVMCENAVENTYINSKFDFYKGNSSLLLFEDTDWQENYRGSGYNFDFTGRYFNKLFVDAVTFEIKDDDGRILFKVENGRVVKVSDEVTFFPVMANNSNTECVTGILSCQSSSGNISMEKGSITTFANNKAVQIQCDGTMDAEINNNLEKLTVDAKTDNDIYIASENILNTNSYDAVTIKGTLNADEKIELNNKGNKNYSAETDSDNRFDVKAITEKGENELNNTNLNTVDNNIFNSVHTIFTDISSLTERQKDAVAYSAEKGVVNGYEDGTFRPYNTITRAEFATMMCRYFGFDASRESEFDDSRYHWASKYIRACTDKGAINGIGNNLFNPDGTITFEQAAKIFTILKGYTKEVNIDAEGGYPDAYIKIGNKLNLFKDMTVTSVGRELPRVDVAMMIYNASEITDDMSYTPDMDNNNEILNINDGSKYTLDAGFSFAGFITNDGELYTWGENDDYQLGNGTNKNMFEPTFVMNGVKKFFAGVSDAALINEDDELYMWGDNFLGVYSPADKEAKYIRNPTKVMDDVAYCSLTHGSQQGFVIKTNGDLYGWGSNKNGQIGDGTTNKVFTPKKVMDNVKYVWGEDDCTLAIRNNGDLYAWGENSWGTIGNGTTEDSYNPIKVMSNVKMCRGGLGFSAALTNNGSLYMWGAKCDGIFGVDPYGDEEIITTPQKVMSDVVYFDIEEENVLAIKNDGSLYSFGRNGFGVLGNGTDEKTAVPQKIMDNAVNCAIGAEVAIAENSNGDLYAWGTWCNNNENEKTNYTPQKITGWREYREIQK